MSSASGPTLRVGVLVPETNTTLRSDFARLSMPGVETVWEELAMGNGQMADDGQHADVISAARGSTFDAIERIAQHHPDCVVMGFVIDTFWGGRAGSLATVARLRDAAEGRTIISGGDAALAALDVLGARRIGLVTPYQPAADRHVARYFEESGIEVAALAGMRAPTAAAIAEIDTKRLGSAVRVVAAHGVDAVVQCGTNVSLLENVEPLEKELGVPVLTMNVLLYWHSLRSNGIMDCFGGFGKLMSQH
jgi:maleate isomerase